MALGLIGGTVFKLLFDGVKLALDNTSTFKYLLRDLKFTLESLERVRATAIQRIGEYNLELGLANDEIEDLKKQMEEGAKLVVKLSGRFFVWNYCCINCYTDQLVDLDRSLKRLLDNLRLQETGDVKEILDLLRKARNELDEVKVMLQKLLQEKMTETSSASESNAETMPDRNAGIGEKQEASLETGGELGAVFRMLVDVVIQVKDKTMMFRPLLGDLKFKLDSLKPLIEEMAQDNKVLVLPNEELEKFTLQMDKGVELVRKCSKVCLGGSYKKYEYTSQLLGLDEFLRRQLNILTEQLEREVRETLASVRNIKTEIQQIERCGVIQNQIEIKGPLGVTGLCEVTEPLLPTVGLEAQDVQETRDVIKETQLSSRNIEEGAKGIEGSGVVQNQSSRFSMPTKLTSFLSKKGEKSQKVIKVGLAHLNLSLIAKATSNFSSQKIGEGRFGSVYKAKLSDGQVVCITRAKKEHYEYLQTEFRSEVEILKEKSGHLNLVKLLGYVDEGEERLIITEYVPNGDLREHLDGLRGKILTFIQRLNIAVDVAHALTYLHLYAEKPIIHGELKSSNILLTESLRAKVADFGYISTKVKGTVGYLDPEYLLTNELTPKSDVYSLGILLLEIVTGRRPVELKRRVEERVTLRWAFKKFNEGSMVGLVDPAMEEAVDAEVLGKLFELAFCCVAPSGADRPGMKRVAEQLWNIRKDYLKSV